MSPRRPFRLLASLTVWAAALFIGFLLLIRYSSTAGASGRTPETWPAQTSLLHENGRPTLLMFLHPLCPCSQASVEELNRLLARTSDTPSTQVVFVPAPESRVEETPLWAAAVGLPGVEVTVDADLAEARRFGAATSGATLLYDGDGRLVFHGGITAARGHAGDNAGAGALLAALRGEAHQPAQTPVFGCPLFDAPTLAEAAP